MKPNYREDNADDILLDLVLREPLEGVGWTCVFCQADQEDDGHADHRDHCPWHRAVNLVFRTYRERT